MRLKPVSSIYDDGYTVIPEQLVVRMNVGSGGCDLYQNVAMSVQIIGVDGVIDTLYIDLATVRQTIKELVCDYQE